MSFTMNPKNPDGDKLDVVATLIFSDHGRAADRKIDLNGLRVYLDKENVSGHGGVGLNIKGATKIEEKMGEAKVESKSSSSVTRLSADSSAGYLGEEIRLDHGHCFPMPLCKKTGENEKKFRQVYYISGPCDCGKSTWIAKMLRLWMSERKKLGQSTDIYLFSKVTGDNAFKGLPVQQIELNQALLDNPFDTNEELHDCMVIFDDIDSIMDKKMKEYLWRLRDELLTVNSHHGTYIINTSHQLCNWKSTRSSLTEAHTITVFPLSERPKLTKFLDEHIGLEREHRQFLMNDAAFKSRWVTFSPRYPYYMVYETGAKVLLPKAQASP